MKKVLAIILSLIFGYAVLFCEKPNLLHNPGFEPLSQNPIYPIGVSWHPDGTQWHHQQVDTCIGEKIGGIYQSWHSADTATPDYLCRLTAFPQGNDVAIPSNIFDYNYGYDNDNSTSNSHANMSYIGLRLMENTDGNGSITFQWQEYIEQKLPQSLTPGSYKFSYYISQATNFPLNLGFTNESFKTFGAYFLDRDIFVPNFTGDITGYIPQGAQSVINNNFISTTADDYGLNGWEKVIGSFTVSSGEIIDHILFGHFGNLHGDANRNNDATWNQMRSYYYIDGLSLTKSCLIDDFNITITQANPTVGGQTCYQVDIWPKSGQGYSNLHFKAELESNPNQNGDMPSLSWDQNDLTHRWITICFENPDPTPSDLKLTFNCYLTDDGSNFDPFCAENIRVDYRKICGDDFNFDFTTKIMDGENSPECCYSVTITPKQWEGYMNLISGIDVEFYKNDNGWKKIDSKSLNTSNFNSSNPTINFITCLGELRNSDGSVYEGDIHATFKIHLNLDGIDLICVNDASFPFKCVCQCVYPNFVPHLTETSECCYKLEISNNGDICSIPIDHLNINFSSANDLNKFKNYLNPLTYNGHPGFFYTSDDRNRNAEFRYYNPTPHNYLLTPGSSITIFDNLCLPNDGGHHELNIDQISLQELPEYNTWQNCSYGLPDISCGSCDCNDIIAAIHEMHAAIMWNDEPNLASEYQLLFNTLANACPVYGYQIFDNITNQPLASLFNSNVPIDLQTFNPIFHAPGGPQAYNVDITITFYDIDGNPICIKNHLSYSWFTAIAVKSSPINYSGQQYKTISITNKNSSILNYFIPTSDDIINIRCYDLIGNEFNSIVELNDTGAQITFENGFNNTPVFIVVSTESQKFTKMIYLINN